MPAVAAARLARAISGAGEAFFDVPPEMEMRSRYHPMKTKSMSMNLSLIHI